MGHWRMKKCIWFITMKATCQTRKVDRAMTMDFKNSSSSPPQMTMEYAHWRKICNTFKIDSVWYPIQLRRPMGQHNTQMTFKIKVTQLMVSQV